MDWTKTFVAATGLRPTAIGAAMRIKPTLMAGKRRQTYVQTSAHMIFPFLSVALDHTRSSCSKPQLINPVPKQTPHAGKSAM